MVKANKKQLILASALTLLPALLGLLQWNRLPELMESRWGFDGSVPVLVILFVQPFLLLGLMWLCICFTAKDPGNRERNHKVSTMMFWTIPVISNLMAAMMFAVSLGAAQAMPKVFLIVLSLMFAVIGNYMPKTKRNSTIGIKVSWALASDENWNATHRFAGRLWFICGILMMLTVCLPTRAGILLFIGLIFCFAFAPVIYSYLYYRKQVREGTAPDVKKEMVSRYGKWGLGFGAVILVFAVILMFVGNIDYSFQADRLAIEADLYTDMSIEYADIDSVEYRETEDRGVRAMGWGSARLLMGAFENEEFGVYTRYSYTGCGSCVVVRSGEKVLVLSGRDDVETKVIYGQLKERVAP